MSSDQSGSLNAAGAQAQIGGATVVRDGAVANQIKSGSGNLVSSGAGGLYNLKKGDFTVGNKIVSDQKVKGFKNTVNNISNNYAPPAAAGSGGDGGIMQALGLNSLNSLFGLGGGSGGGGTTVISPSGASSPSIAPVISQTVLYLAIGAGAVWFFFFRKKS
jgi:hypothetical protein